MKKYYYNCPRGFSNEFSIITVEQSNTYEVERFNKYYESYLHSSSVNWDLHQITAKHAKELIQNERAQARAYKRAGLNNEIVGATDYITATEFFQEG